MFSEFFFPYGNDFLSAHIPAKNIATVLKTGYSAGLENMPAVLEQALKAPIDRPPLADCVKRNDKVAVIVTDATRACPDDLLLPPILKELERSVSKDNITIIVALGLHAPLDREALIKKLGRAIIEKYHVINHDVNDTVRLGITSRGTPVEINRRVVESNFRISTGFIEPHFFAGFSGGSKSMAPGVSGPNAINHNHSYEMLEHPLSRAGILDGNPVHEDIVEQATIAGLDFIVNVLLNEKKEITHIVAGDPVKAHEKGCELEKSVAMFEVKNAVDITITSNSGAPLDLDLYQACKGIDNASSITRDGGSIIIASSCTTGVGPDTFETLHTSFSSPEEILQEIKNGKSTGVQWQNHILTRAQLKNDIYLVSELDDILVRKMMMEPVHSIEEGLDKALLKAGNDAKIAVIPEGPLVLPRLSIEP